MKGPENDEGEEVDAGEVLVKGSFSSERETGEVGGMEGGVAEPRVE